MEGGAAVPPGCSGLLVERTDGYTGKQVSSNGSVSGVLDGEAALLVLGPGDQAEHGDEEDEEAHEAEGGDDTGGLHPATGANTCLTLARKCPTETN